MNDTITSSASSNGSKKVTKSVKFVDGNCKDDTTNSSATAYSTNSASSDGNVDSDDKSTTLILRFADGCDKHLSVLITESMTGIIIIIIIIIITIIITTIITIINSIRLDTTSKRFEVFIC